MDGELGRLDRPARRERAGSGRGRESPLYEVACPFLYVARFFGLAPYAYPRGNAPPRLRPSGPHCLYSLLWAGVYSWVVVTALMRFGGLERDKPVLGVTENGKLVLNYATALAELGLAVGRRRRLARVWNGLQAFDEAFRLGYAGAPGRRLPAPLSRARRCLWLAALASVLLWTAINQLGMHAFNETYLQNLGYMLTYVATYLSTLKFVGLVALLGQRFRHLNGLLAERRAERPRPDRALAEKVEAWYNRLLSTSESLNDIYSGSLFLFLLNLFCHAVSNMYFFTIWTIVDPSYLSNPQVVFCLFIWLLVYLMQLLLLHLSCHLTSLEANRMASVLLDWQRRRAAERHWPKHHHFRSTLHYSNRRLKFTAAGCFELSLPVLTTTFGHLTTYLVILLQIPDSGSS